MRQRLIRAVAVGALVWTAGHGAALSAQARDVSGAPPVRGTAELRGRVLTPGDDPKPVRRAIVTIAGDGLTHGRSTVTDDEGRFSVGSLPGGRFLVTATKPAHLPAAFGARQPGRPGVAIQLADGERRTDVTFVMAKGAAVAGVLRTAAGEPAAGIDVGVFRLPAPGLNLHLAPAGSATSDDRGMYRVYGLPPGNYVVAASVRRRLPGNGDAELWSSEQVDATLRHLADPSAPPPSAPAGRFNWAPIYFPGAASPTQAVPIRLRAGDDRDGVDLTVSMVRMAIVEGILLGDPDVVRSAQFFFNALGTRLEPLLGATPVYSSRMTPAGKVFTYTGVAPGLYSVTAHIPESGGQWARAEFQVDGQDLLDLAITPRPAVRVSGRLIFEGMEAPPPGMLRGATIRPVPTNGIGQAASGSTRMGNPFVPAGSVSETGSFEIRGVVPETVTFSVTAPGAPGWIARSVTINGVDVLDVPFTITGDVTDVVVMMSNQPTRLSGRITNEAGAPGTSLFIAAFAQDRTWWRPLSRRITSARADTDGRWIIDGLPPGEYFLVALTDVGEELSDPEFLQQLIPAALRVTLAAGEQKVQDLRIGAR